VHGKPQREISTAEGTLLFYGPLLIGIEGGAVRFISVQELAPAVAVSVPEPTPEEDRRTEWVELRTSPFADFAARLQALRLAKRLASPAEFRLERRLTGRLRRALAAKIHRAMTLELTGGERHGAAWGGAALRTWMTTGAADTAARPAESEALLAVKDAHSRRLERYGETFEAHDPFVMVRETLEGAWSGGM